MLGSELIGERGYEAPRHLAPEGATWLHALHGNVPDHQIDFIYSPEAPQGAFTRTHLGHLARLMKYIEPRTGSPFAFAIGNLSRDDTQHEPGHGAVALMFGFRVVGAIDSAGRQDPPLAHAIIAVDREMTYRALLEATMSLFNHLAGYAGSCSPGVFYERYARAMAERPEEVPGLLEQYIGGFRELPALRASSLGEDFVEGEEARPGRIFLVHEEGEPFGSIAHAAARLAAVLYRSSLRWTSIVFGGVADIPGGWSIELVSSLPVNVRPEDRVLRLADLPEEEEALARELFGARRVTRQAAVKWEDDAPTLVRPLVAEGESGSGGGSEIEVEVDLGGLAEEPKPAAAPAVAAAPRRAPAAAGVMTAGKAAQWRDVELAARRDGEEAQRGGSRGTRPGARWIKAAVLGTGVLVGAVALLAARGWEEPTAGAAGPAVERPAEEAVQGPAPMQAPVVVDVERKAEAPREALARAAAEVPVEGAVGAGQRLGPMRAGSAPERGAAAKGKERLGVFGDRALWEPQEGSKGSGQR